MVTKRKKQLTRVLLGVCALQLVMPLLLMISILFVQAQQHEALKNASGHSVTIALENNVDGGEVEYDGMLYDVQHVERRDGQYIIYAMADTRETQLVALSGRAPDNMQVAKSLKIFPFFFLYHEVVAERSVVPFTIPAPLYASFEAKPFGVPGVVDIPPPRGAFA